MSLATKYCLIDHIRIISGAIRASSIIPIRLRRVVNRLSFGAGTFGCTDTHMQEKIVAKQLQTMSQIVLVDES